MAEPSTTRRPRRPPHPAEERSAGSVATRTFNVLLDQIQTFRLKPYELVSEKTMSEALGVSRTPVREALARLDRVGLIDIYPQRGSVVAPLRMSDLAKSQFLREALEVGLMLRALESPDRMALVQRLRDELAIQETFAAISDDRRFYKSDEALHRHIASHAGFPGIWTDIMDAKLHMDRFRYLTFPRIDNMSIVLAQHRAIVDAIEAGDRAAAEEAMRSHLRRVLSVVHVARERFPDYFDPADVPSEEDAVS